MAKFYTIRLEMMPPRWTGLSIVIESILKSFCKLYFDNKVFLITSGEMEPIRWHKQ